jgi:tRNA U34 5-methylaminomethyl-2-thiouridine-forming methyltransferase MnmC
MSEALEIQLIQTADGSHSLYRADIDETYHSRHGALKESKYVFIEKGLHHVMQRQTQLSILEVGFGTGLNAWLTWKEALAHGLAIHYTGLEPNVLSADILDQFAFNDWTEEERGMFQSLHTAGWDEVVPMDEVMLLEKRQEKVQQLEPDPERFDLVYYDAFGPRAQQEMWHDAVFRRLYATMMPGGILVTYCAKGQVRRDLEAIGFAVERLEGPPGKREMLRATKIDLNAAGN